MSNDKKDIANYKLWLIFATKLGAELSSWSFDHSAILRLPSGYYVNIPAELRIQIEASIGTAAEEERLKAHDEIWT